MAYLWPAVERGRLGRASLHPELVAIYATRAEAPLEMWRALLEQATREIGLLVYAAVHLHEVWPDFNDVLRDRAAAGCRVRIMLGDPDSATVAARGKDERYGHGIETRCRVALMHYMPLIGTPGIEVHQHGTTLYNSIYHGDDQMIVNTHRFGINAYGAPVLRIRRRGEGGLFDGYLESLETVWNLSCPATTDTE
ncbi:MAG: XRE family transcriptional regulator [Sporichthyaceae bacterium]|nr:XRE family transcriptional regulator [Sporichthyaceae bacterium]